MIGRVAVAGVLAAAGVARADAPTAASEPPDPAVEEAGDANLESGANPSGVTFSASLGGGMIVGFGIDDSAGRGGAVSVRLGHVATPRTVIALGIDVTLALHQPKGEGVTANSDTNLLVSAQHYVNPSLWLRFGGGIGVYQRKQVVVAVVDGMEQLGDRTLLGPAALAGLGLDLVRFKWVVLGIEAATTAMVNREGVLLASHLNLGVSFN
ncbi:MAG TPA: hypothetical protein VF469_29655 [Kofleriaceae bacterium]